MKIWKWSRGSNYIYIHIFKGLRLEENDYFYKEISENDATFGNLVASIKFGLNGH